MKIEVRFRKLEASHGLQEYVLRRIHFLLSRFDGGVRAVVVRVGDINGPKGGTDKRCQVTVRGPGLGPITVDELSEDVHSAIDVALERVARAVAREIARGRDARRISRAVMWGKAS